MTYCVALRLDTGMIFASDSRTNAGVDHIATFTKMRVYEKKDDRVIVTLSSGNLAMTQGVINILDRQSKALEGEDTIWNVESMYDAAGLVGDALREMHRRDGPFLSQSSIEASSSLLVGGQIKGEAPRLFHIYAQGNFIEATDDTPYFQLGESKYGKPILDRVISMATPQKEAAKCVLISFDSTMKSNISVGLPIDLLWYPRDSMRVGMQQRIREGDPYFTMLRSRWGGGLRRVFGELPDPDWLGMNPTLDHIGYNVSNLPQAREFFTKALAPLGIGVVIEGEGWVMFGRGDHPGYYGAFVIGPDGHNIEAVCHRPE